MKKIIFCAAATAALLASCSNEETVEVNQNNPNLIRFSATTENATRADGYTPSSKVYCNANPVEAFTVFAFDETGKTVIDGDEYTYDGTIYKSANNVERYWPKEGKLNFYAVNNGVLSFESGKAVVKGYTVAEGKNGKDLVYAVASASKADVNNTIDKKVNLNFRHALSQVVFAAKVSQQAKNDNLTVNVKGVTVCNVPESGNYEINPALTSVNIDHSGSHSANDYSSVTAGVWTPAGDKANFGASLDAYTLISDVVTISAPNSDNALLLIPGNYSAWTKDDNNGTYFLVDCQIYQQVKATEEKVTVWEGQVLVPFSATWEQGKRYLYTFVFGNGTGIDPNNPNNPIFVPISFNVKVDEFVNGNEANLDLAGKNAE